MGSHPLNLAFRFMLELAALGALGTYGWLGFESPARWIAAVGLPLLFAISWGTFAVPDDPSRGGRAPVPVRGFVRLGLELSLFAASVFALHLLGFSALGWALGGAVVVHNALSIDRIAWLLER